MNYWSEREKARGASSTEPSHADNVDRSGVAIIALFQQALDLSKEESDQALATAHELSLRLRAAEDRANKLQAQVEQSQDRAHKAEHWLSQIQSEIEEKFFRKEELKSERS